MKKILLTIIAIAGVWMNAMALDDVPAWQNDWTSAPAKNAKFYLYNTTDNNGFVKGDMGKSVPFVTAEEATPFIKLSDGASKLTTTTSNGTYYLKANTNSAYTNEKDDDWLGYARSFTFRTNNTGKFALTFSFTVLFVTTQSSICNKNGNFANNEGTNSGVYKYEWYLINEKQYNNHMAYKRYHAAAYEALNNHNDATDVSKAWRDKYLNLDYKLKDLSTVDHSEEINALTAEIKAWNANPEKFALLKDTDSYPEIEETLTHIDIVRTIKAGTWNTLWLPFDMDIPTGWTVKELTGVTYDGAYDAQFTEVTDGKIVAGKPYLVKVTTQVDNMTREDENGFTLKTTDAVNVTSDNGHTLTFNGVTTPGNLANCYFISGGVFYFAPEGNGNTSKTYRAIFTTDQQAGAALAFSFVEDDTDGINSVNANAMNDGYIYNLAGQRIEAPVRGQIYIKNGKKYIFK